MKKLNSITVQKNESLSTAIEKIYTNNSRTVFVLNKKKVVGVISEGDIIKTLIYQKSLNTSLEKIMNKSFKFLKSKNLTQAKKIFKDTGIGLIPIINKNMEIKSYITIFDII
tara:strand:- start:225 stop:560 length:336 start_codon:yes stop_codon:yes gene_type:complete